MAAKAPDKDRFEALREECRKQTAGQIATPFTLIEGGHLWIRTKPPVAKLKVLTPETMFPAQLKLYRRIKELFMANLPIRLRIGKARQEGFSTIIQAIMYSWAATKSVAGLVVGNDLDNSSWLFGMSQRFQQTLEERKTWPIKPLKKSTAKVIAWQGSDSEIRHGTAGSPNLGTTVTRALVHLSEYAFYRNPLELRSKILASIPHLGGTMVIIETTGNGYGPFYDEWMQEEREPGSTGFENMFFGWTEHPEYRLEA